jgi:hypothetical protein
VRSGERVLIDGVTDDGLRVRVTERPIQDFAVFLHGECVEITEADRLRDGGTTIIETVRGEFVGTRPRSLSEASPLGSGRGCLRISFPLRREHHWQ